MAALRQTYKSILRKVMLAYLLTDKEIYSVTRTFENYTPSLIGITRIDGSKELMIKERLYEILTYFGFEIHEDVKKETTNVKFSITREKLDELYSKRRKSM